MQATTAMDEALGTPVQSPMASDHDTRTVSSVPTEETEPKSGLNNIDRQNDTALEQPLTQVDDPLEAMDVLEDAIEEVGQALPTVDENAGLDSPSRRSSIGNETGALNGTTGQAVTAKEASPSSRKLSNANPPSKPGSRTSSMSSQKQMQSSVAKPQVSRNTLSRRPSSNAGDPKASIQSMSRRTSHSSVSSSNAPTTRSSSGGLVPTSKLSVHKPGFVPAKSGKQPTRSTFELPGEAISRRKRADREEQIRREEEELHRRRSFKASGIRYSMGGSTKPRETATSKARANRMSQVFDAGSNASASVDGPRPTSALKRQSSVARTQSTAPKTTTGPQKARGKETFFGREESERREKEEMAKRARAEASERSRQLSRQWAEKQRLKQKVAKAGTNDLKKENQGASMVSQ